MVKVFFLPSGLVKGASNSFNHHSTKQTHGRRNFFPHSVENHSSTKLLKGAGSRFVQTCKPEITYSESNRLRNFFAQKLCANYCRSFFEFCMTHI